MWRVKVLVINSMCLTLRFQDCSPPSSSPHGILQARILEWVSSVQLLSRVWLFATPWTAAQQASLSITNSWSLLKPMSIVSVIPFNHLILCRPLLLLPSNLPSIRVLPHSTAQKGGSGRETFNTKPVKLGLNHSLSHPHTHAPSKVLHLLPQLRTVG